MKKEPGDINNQSFKVRFRGFDTKEVEAFRQAVAKELEERTQENKSLQEKIAENQREIAELKSLLGDREKAELEAKRRKAEIEETCASMLKEARLTAEEILKGARIERDNINVEIENTRKFKDQSEKYFESFLEFNIKLLKMWKKEVDKTP